MQINNDLENITKGDYGKYLFEKNEKILSYLNKILSFLNIETFPNQNVNSYEIFNDTVSILYDIYSYHLENLEDFIPGFFESINTLEDLYSKMVLGKPHVFFITQYHFEELNNIQEILSILVNKMARISL